MTSKPLADRIALVTGASRGIGAATALALARAGAHVVAIARTVGGLEELDDAIRAVGSSATLVPLDLMDYDGIDRLALALNERYRKLDVLIGNAGILGPMCPMMEETSEGYDQVNAVNLRGVWAFMKHELIQMKKQGSGAIVNCSSLGGLVGQPGRAAYHATKHGVIGLTKSAALDVAAQGIRVNAVCPGCIETPMGDGIDPAAMKEFLKQQPIGRMGKPEEIAGPVLFLCTEYASFITGEVFNVNGGAVLPG